MKLKRLSLLMLSSTVCVGLTQCTTANLTTKTNATKAGTAKASTTKANTAVIPENNRQANAGLNYPATRTTAQGYDGFVSGEYGRPSGATPVGGGDFVGYASPRLKPNEGVYNYAYGKIEDKFSWLEDVDVIDYAYRNEQPDARNRNLIGSHLEADRPNGQLDNRMQEALRQVPTPKSSEINTWVDEQNIVTQNYIQSIPYYEQVKANLDSLLYYRHRIRKVDMDNGDVVEFYRNDKGQYVISRFDKNDNETVLKRDVDLRIGGQVGYFNGDDVYFNEAGTYVAYIIGLGSADADRDSLMLHVLDTRTGKDVIEPTRVMYDTSPSWIDDNSFYYVNEVDNLLRYDIGVKRFNDPIIIKPNYLDGGAYISGADYLDDDKRYLSIDAYQDANTFYIKDMKTNKIYRIHNKDYKDNVLNQADSFRGATVKLASLVHFDEKTRSVWFISTENDPRGEILKITLDNPNKRTVVVPAYEGYQLMQDAVYHDEGDGYFLVKYLKDGSHRVILMNAQGLKIKDLTPTQVADIDDLDSHVVSKENDKIKDKKDKDDDDELNEDYISFRLSNPSTPRSVYKYSIKKDEFIDTRRKDLYPFDETQFESIMVKYPSKDGTMVPMSISYKKDIKLDGNNPVMIFGYGGFGFIYPHSFNGLAATWMEHGGVWAVPNLRGGGEYGVDWHEDGKRLNKINVFDDAEAAADYLVAKGYTSYDRLGIHGGSNGGLLVGAAMTLTPNKYRVAIPAVGVLDMMRQADNWYTRYWMDEYGTPHDSKAMYDYLLSYSPYHNVKAGVCYPATLVDTSKRDDRVTPAHSYKFAAALQDKQSCARPVLLRADEHHGHGANTFDERFYAALDKIAFSLHEMGIQNVPDLTKRASPESYKSERWLREEAREKAKRLKKGVGSEKNQDTTK